MTTMVVPIHDPSATSGHAYCVNEDTDLRLSELTENSLLISTTREITRINNNNTLTNFNQAKLYSNGLFDMTQSSPKITTRIGESATNEFKSYANASEKSSATIGISVVPQTTDVAADVGLLANIPDSWNDWESNRRSDFSVIPWKKCQHKKQLRLRKRIKHKNIEPKKAKNSASATCFHRRRLSLERSIGRHLREGCLDKRPSVLKTIQDSKQSDVVPFQSSKSLRRRQRRRRVVRFREEIEEEILDWKREQQVQQQRQNVTYSGQRLGAAADTKTPFLEAGQERKQSQRALLDLQVGMKCMGL